MNRTKIMRWCAICWAAVMLSACDNRIEMGPDPHEIAIEFFDLFYNERDLDGALALASKEYRPILERYGTINAISRYMFNMNFDEVMIEADRQGVQLYREQADTARVQVSFAGVRGNSRQDTLRDVVMVREGSRWRVSRVIDVL